MNGTLSLPPSLVVRDLLLTAFSKLRTILLLSLCVMALAAAIALRIQPDYSAKSTLLVLLGPEYAFRPAAGQQFSNIGNVESEQVLRTEAGILASDDLHRSVIREIGLATLYPKLLEPRTEFQRWMHDTRTELLNLVGAKPDAGAAASNDPLSLAVERFATNLSIVTDKKSSVIQLNFTHPNPAVARKVLSVLETQYLALRQTLYGDVQAPIVQVQQNTVGKQLADADAALAKFKREHDISSFKDRQNILLHQQGDLETALSKADAAISGEQARVDQLTKQLATAIGQKHGTPAAALQGMVQAYRNRESESQTRYRGSPAVDEARREALERQTDIAKMRSTQAFALNTDLDKAEANLRASVAGRETTKAQLADVNKQISALDAEESQLHQLELQRGVLEDDYKAVTKILDEREVVETVNAHRESSVRVIQPPQTPPYPQPLRRIILLAGVVISILLAAGVTLFAHFFRASYLRPEALEYDTGLIVLASVPETRALARSVLLIGPG